MKGSLWLWLLSLVACHRSDSVNPIAEPRDAASVAATSATAAVAAAPPHAGWKTLPPGPMALIKGGSFIMGADNMGYSDAQ